MSEIAKRSDRDFELVLAMIKQAQQDAAKQVNSVLKS